MRSRVMAAALTGLVACIIVLMLVVSVKLGKQNQYIEPKDDGPGIVRVVERKHQMLSTVTYVLEDNNGNRYLLASNGNGTALVLMPPAAKETP